MRDTVCESWTVTKRRVQSFSQRLGATDRGLSTALNYVLVLGIVSILVTTLLAGFGGLVANQQEEASRAQLEVIGNRVAADVGQVNTLVASDDRYNQTVRTDLPTRVVGASYTLTVTSNPDIAEEGYYLFTLSTGDPKTTVTVPFRSTTEIVTGTIYGGPLVIEYNHVTEKVEIYHG